MTCCGSTASIRLGSGREGPTLFGRLWDNPNLVPGEGVEPPTHAFRKRRSDTELPRRRAVNVTVSDLQFPVEQSEAI